VGGLPDEPLYRVLMLLADDFEEVMRALDNIINRPPGTPTRHVAGWISGCSSRRVVSRPKQRERSARRARCGSRATRSRSTRASTVYGVARRDGNDGKLERVRGECASNGFLTNHLGRLAVRHEHGCRAREPET